MKPPTEIDHRAKEPAIARLTAQGAALSPFTLVATLVALGLGTGDHASQEFRALLGSFAEGFKIRRRSTFDALAAISLERDRLVARVAVRFRRLDRTTVEFVARPCGLAVIGFENATSTPPLEVAERLLAAPIAAAVLDGDGARRACEEHLRLNGGRWLIAFGKPFRDADGVPLRGVQEARERAANA